MAKWKVGDEVVTTFGDRGIGRVDGYFVDLVRVAWPSGHRIWHAEEALTAAQSPPAPDLVNHPPHYTTGGIETIDFIRAKQLDYCLGNVVKYITRAPHKGNEVQDLKKARWYLDRAISERKEGDGERGS